MKRIMENALPIRANPLREIVTGFSLELRELAGGQKQTVVKGVAAKANIVNRNERYYSREVYQKAIEEAQADLQAGRMNGLLDHPDPWSEPAKGKVKNIAIKWEKFELDGDDFKVEGVIVGTTAGQELQALADAKVALGLSTNGSGTQKFLKAKEVIQGATNPDQVIGVIQDDYRLFSIDVVSDPSNVYGQLARESWQRMTLEELKAKDPLAYARLLAEAKAEVDKEKPQPADNSKEMQALETRIIALETENKTLKADKTKTVRLSFVTSALADAKLPELDLDARFRKQLENAVLNAESDEAAQQEIAEMIEERKALVGTREVSARNTPDIPAAKTESKPAPEKENLVKEARRMAGLN